MIGIPRLIGYSLAVSFFTLLITSTFTTQIQLVYAGGKSPYESGYDHGCDDADISDSDDRYINQPEKGLNYVDYLRLGLSIKESCFITI